MIWLAVIALAAAAFGVAALVLKTPRAGWMAIAAALLFGLTGFAWQAQPSVPSAPRAASEAQGADGWDLVEGRKEMVAESDRSQDGMVILADGQTRKGHFETAAGILEGVVAQNPGDYDAWLALGNVLVEHGQGTLSPAALHAYRQADAARPGSVGPGYFIGIALIRQGQLLEARDAWASTLANAAPDAAGRAGLELRLRRFEELLQQAVAPPLSGQP